LRQSSSRLFLWNGREAVVNEMRQQNNIQAALDYRAEMPVIASMPLLQAVVR